MESEKIIINLSEKTDKARGEKYIYADYTGKIVPTVDGRPILIGDSSYYIEAIPDGSHTKLYFTINECRTFLDAFTYVVCKFSGMVNITNWDMKYWSKQLEERCNLYYRLLDYHII